MKSVNGVGTTKGLITIKVKIFDIEKEMDVYIIEKEDFEDFIIGIDMVKSFKLTQDEKLEITQKKDINIGKTDKRIKIDNTDHESNYNETKRYSVNFNEHIKEDEFKVKLDHLDNIKKIQIEKLIEQYKPIFAKDKYDIGTVRDYEARIDLIVEIL